MSVSRAVIAEAFNLKEEDVTCNKCSAHGAEVISPKNKDGVLIYCKYWNTACPGYGYCSMFIP